VGSARLGRYKDVWDGRRLLTIRRGRLALALAGLLLLGVPEALRAGATTPPPPPGSPAVESAPTSITGINPELPASVLSASAAPGSTWTPEQAMYGSASTDDIAVAGAGGTTIRVNEIYPTTSTGAPAAGPFPVLLTMTPYGKGQGGSSSPGSASSPATGSTNPTGGADNYLVQRGYIEVVMDVRGTGDSNGEWGLFDPIQTQDAIDVLDWAANLPHANGSVGTYGPSYLGIDQLLLAGAVGKGSPLKAIFPVVAANDIYRDAAAMGGLADFEFDEAYLGLTGGANIANPVGDTLSDPQLLADLGAIELDHANGLASYHAATELNALGNGDEAYDGDYWQARNPANVLADIVANGIPAYLVGGEFDLFQNGAPLNYAGLQNAYDGRPTSAPMLPYQPVTGRYQLVDGPWTHLNGSTVDIDPLELEWFDTWLKGEDTGMAYTPTPLHYYDLGSGNFDETSTFPFKGSSPATYYFGPGGTLSAQPPTSQTAGGDNVVWSPVGSPCGRPVDQWSMGGLSIAASEAGVLAPCAESDTTTQAGPWATTYTTAPLAQPATVAGPITVAVYATATTTETQWVAEVEAVTPDGTSFPLTEGALLGSLRAVDPSRSWIENGATVLPYHPYTQASVQPVTPGLPEEYQIQVFPTLVTLAKGDSLRVTISTVDTPHLAPIPNQLMQLLGGTYDILRTPGAPSSVTVELDPALTPATS
jgi:putative CocE/NonD family hydrolase